MAEEQDTQSVSEAKNKGELRPKDYERIGRGLESVVLSGHYSKKRLFWFNLLRGIVFGIGSAIGATLIIAGTLYMLSLFSELPWIGQLFENLRTTVQDVNSSVNN